MPPIGTKQAGLLTPYIGQEGEALRQKAIRLFSDSNANCADHYVTWHNMGMCYEYKGDIENAKRCYLKVGEIQLSEG